MLRHDRPLGAAGDRAAERDRQWLWRRGHDRFLARRGLSSAHIVTITLAPYLGSTRPLFSWSGRSFARGAVAARSRGRGIRYAVSGRVGRASKDQDPAWSGGRLPAAAYVLRAIVSGRGLRPDMPIDAVLGALLLGLVAVAYWSRRTARTDEPRDDAPDDVDAEDGGEGPERQDDEVGHHI